MAIIQNPAIARKLQRGLRLTGLPDSVLALETVPVILVEDFSAPLTDTARGCAGATGQGAVAAEFTLIALVRVGAPAEYDLVVTGVHFSSQTTQLIRVAIPTAGLVGLSIVGNTSFLDLSIPGRPSSQLGVDTQASIPAARMVWRYSCLANVTYRIPMNLRIGTIGDPGDLTSLMIVGETANTSLIGGFEWTEQPPQG